MAGPTSLSTRLARCMTSHSLWHGRSLTYACTPLMRAACPFVGGSWYKLAPNWVPHSTSFAADTHSGVKPRLQWPSSNQNRSSSSGEKSAKPSSICGCPGNGSVTPGYHSSLTCSPSGKRATLTYPP